MAPDVFKRTDGVKFPLLTEPSCPICSIPIQEGYEQCYWCNKYNIIAPFTKVKAVEYYFEEEDQPHHILSQEIRAFKHDPSLAPQLAELLIYVISTRYPKLMEFDTIVPVPKASKIRPYNQCELLAKIVSKHFGIECLDILYTKEEYPPLYDKDLNERQQIISGKIGCNTDVEGKKILLIDDVCTTGVTISECAKVLKENGASKVVTLVLGKKVDNTQLEHAGRKYE